MVMNQNELSNIFCKIGKKLNIRGDENITIDELVKRIINKDLNYSLEKKTFDLTEPSLLSAFFINNVIVDCDREILRKSNKNFDLDLLYKINQINGDKYELIDFNRNKVKVCADDINFVIKNKIPVDLFMKILN